MANFYGGQMSLADQQQQVEQYQQYQQQQQQIDSIASGIASQADSNATTPGDALLRNPPMRTMFGPASSHTQQEANRRASMSNVQSIQAYASQLHPTIGQNMSIIGSPNVSTAGNSQARFDAFNFASVNPAGTAFDMSAIAPQQLDATPTQQVTSPLSQSSTDFPATQDLFSNIPQDIMNNMLAFSGLDLGHMAGSQPPSMDASSLSFYPSVDSNASANAALQTGVMGGTILGSMVPPLGSGFGSHFSANPSDMSSAFVPGINTNMADQIGMLSGTVPDNLAVLAGQQHSSFPSVSPPSHPQRSQHPQQNTAAAATAASQAPLQVSISPRHSLIQPRGSVSGVTPMFPPSAGAAPARDSLPSAADHGLSATSITPIPLSVPPPPLSTASRAPTAAAPEQGPKPTIRQVMVTATEPSQVSLDVATQVASHPSVSNTTTPPSSQSPRSKLVSQTPTSLAPGKNCYSTSGFDMIRALYYVSSRPHPEIAIGPVDLSCAFVVCDATVDDFPIIYVSDNFQHLTGYSRFEIMGQNCRFLQAPDGKVEAGSKREFTDNSAVHNLKQKLLAGREVQQSLINYRRGGKPFLNLLTMIPIPWDDYKDGYKYFIGLQIDLVESPDAVSGQTTNSVRIDYSHSSIPQYIWDPPNTGRWGNEHGRTLGKDDVSALLRSFGVKALVASFGGSSGETSSTVSADLYRQSWDKMLLENIDDVVHVLSLKGVFLYLSPACKGVLEYDPADLLGNSLSSICHPSDIVPVTREMRDTQAGQTINFVFRVRRKHSGFTWFESHGSLFVEQGKGRKCIVLVGRKRPAFALHRCDVDINGGIGDGELWMKLSTSGMILHASPNMRSLLDLQPDSLVGTSAQDLMRKESRAGFNRSLEKARRGIIASCQHEVQHRRGQVLQASTILYPGDAERGEKPTFVLAQTRLLRPSSRNRDSMASAGSGASASAGPTMSGMMLSSSSTTSYEEIGRAGAVGQLADPDTQTGGFLSSAGGGALKLGSQDAALAADDNIFDELKTTRCTSWQYELRQMEKANRVLAEELNQLLANRKKRKRRKGVGNVPRDCANCHTRNTPEWRRGPSGQRDLCNSCGLRWAKQVGRVSPRNSSRGGNTAASGKMQTSPAHSVVSGGAGAGAGAASTTNATERSGHSGAHRRTISGGSGSAAGVVPDTGALGAATAAAGAAVAAYQVSSDSLDYGDSEAAPRASERAILGATGSGLPLIHTEMEAIREEREAA